MFCRRKLGLWATAGGRPGNARRAWERAREGRGQPGPWGGRVVGDEVGTLGQFGETRGDLGGWE